MKIVVSNPGLGNHVRNTVLAYHERALLDQFYSTMILPNNLLFQKLTAQFKSIKSKQFLDIPNSKISTLLIPELFRLLAARFLSAESTDTIWEWSEHKFDSWVAGNLNKNINVFHGYEHASLSSLKMCKELKIFSVFEQPSVHHKFFTTSVLPLLNSSEKYFLDNFNLLYNSNLSIKRNKRRDEELQIADLILCNSTYVKNSLVAGGVSESKIKVLPLGFPKVQINEIRRSTSIRFLVSGNLSYLKGVHHILRVWKSNQDVFRNHELVCIGNNSLSSEEWDGLPNNVILKGRLSSVEYLEELKKSDVLILNTYSDGFGMVMSEAMAYGKAVISTKNSAASDIISNNESGLIINVGNESELLESMKYLVYDADKLFEIRTNAHIASKNYTWENYRAKLSNLVVDHYENYRNA